MYGAVPLRRIKETLLSFRRAGTLDRVRMVLLTNCTFDGIVYDVERVMLECLAIKPDLVFLWDEAWFAFARCHPIYRQRTGMASAARLAETFGSGLRPPPCHLRRRHRLERRRTAAQRPAAARPRRARVRVYATHSTHKTLTALRQGSMIHVWDQDFKDKVEESFHEAYMTHTSTSPNYQILASLDVGRRQVELEGYELIQRQLELAMSLREQVLHHPLLKRYFRFLRVSDMVPAPYRESGVDNYYNDETGWDNLEAAWQTDEFALDPTRATLTIGATGMDGDTFKNKELMDRYGIQINKTSRNTVLFMTNIGSTRSAIAYLIEVLVKIARDVDARVADMSSIERRIHERRVRSLTLEQPPLPDFSSFHFAFRGRSVEGRAETRDGDIRSAFFLSYEDANCEYIGMVEAGQAIAAGRELVSALFVIPYPPGFPILVPGQVISAEILQFMAALDVREIHGFRPELGFRIFSQAALDLAAQATAARAALALAGRAAQSQAGDPPAQTEPALAATASPPPRSPSPGARNEQQSHQHFGSAADVPPQRAAHLLHQRHQFQPAGHGSLGQSLPLHQLYRLLRRTPSECVRAAGIAACGIRIHRGHQQLPAAAQGRDRHDRASRRQAGGHVPDVRREDRGLGQGTGHGGLVPAGGAAHPLRQQDGNGAHRQQGRRAFGAERAGESGQLRAPDADRGPQRAGTRPGGAIGVRRLGPHHLLHRVGRRFQQAQGRNRQRPRGQDHEAHQLSRRHAGGLRNAVRHAGRTAADRGGGRARADTLQGRLVRQRGLPGAFSEEVRAKARDMAERFGNQLLAEGYRGYFDLDFLIDTDSGEVYLGELNPRICGASPMTNHAAFAYADAPLFLFHLLEFSGVPFDLNVKEINERWAQPRFIDSWSQVVMKFTDEKVDQVTHAPATGIYRMAEDGSVAYQRFDYERRAIDTEREAFFMRITGPGDYRYEGADLGILITRGRSMDDNFKLNIRARDWIRGIKNYYAGKPVMTTQHDAAPAPGSFKIL